MFNINNKKNFLVVGRGATGIYLILKSRFYAQKVLVPANICYAAVYPVLYSGNIPKFCDIDCTSGNLNLNIVKQNIKDVVAVIIPHMYGNPVCDIEKISNFCKQKNVLLIEDCASSMGVEINDKQTGSFGDYAIYSTGYSKTVDLKNGGMIFSNFDLSHEKELYHRLPLYSSKVADANAFFSKQYRLFRNKDIPFTQSEFYNLVNSDLSENFLYRLPDSFATEMIVQISSKLNDIINLRRRNNNLYDRLINFDQQNILNYYFVDGSVPWRKNIFVNKKWKHQFIKHLLDIHISVSDWYPVVSCLFNDTTKYENAQTMEDTILNFPLLLSDEEIYQIAHAINITIEKLNNDIQYND